MTRTHLVQRLRRIASDFERHGHCETADHIRAGAQHLAGASMQQAVLNEDITCDLCQNWDWWVENFGDAAGWIHWLECGPLGLDCDADGKPPQGG